MLTTQITMLRNVYFNPFPFMFLLRIIACRFGHYILIKSLVSFISGFFKTVFCGERVTKPGQNSQSFYYIECEVLKPGVDTAIHTGEVVLDGQVKLL